MSFKIFSLQLLGKIKPVEKIESQRQALYNDYLNFIKVDKSDELVEFLELEKYIQSQDFKKKKEEIQGLHFKGSKEFNQLKEFESLKNSRQLKKYFKTKDSEALNRYRSLRDAEKIKEYRLLLDFIEKGEFQKEKDEIRRNVFKGSVEENKLAEYNKLNKSRGIKAYYELHGSEILERHSAFYQSEKLKKYFELQNLPDTDKLKKKELNTLKKDGEIKAYLKFEHSEKLKLYHETVDSYALKRHGELKVIVESEDFKKRVGYLKDKHKFEKTEAYKKWKRFKELSADTDVKFFLKFEKSAQLKNYYDVKDSMELKRYLELKETVSSDDFRKRKEYLEDNKKWEKTEEYSSEQKYLDMKKLSHLVNYFKYKGTNAFDFFENWEEVFEDDFSGNVLSSEKWSTQSVWAEKLLGKNYSMPGDLHIFTDGNNIKTSGKLAIEIRKEKAEGLIWQMPAGFVPAEFDYTSGLVSTGKSFWQEDGIFEAKIKFSPVKETASLFVLQGEKNSPRIHLLEMGARNRLGIATSGKSAKTEITGLDISNLKKDKWYIFTLKKTGSHLCWKINDTEVLKLDHHQFGFPLHIQLLSIVVNQIPGSKLPVRFETDWVKCFKKK